MAGLSNRGTTGSGAVAALERYRDERFANFGVSFFVKWLDDQGFIIVPKGYSKPARRGNAKPVPYTGPDMIGQSHCGRLAKGS